MEKMQGTLCVSSVTREIFAKIVTPAEEVWQKLLDRSFVSQRIGFYFGQHICLKCQPLPDSQTYFKWEGENRCDCINNS